MTLKINASGLVENYINRYLIWRDFQNFYQQETSPVVEIDPAGIPCFIYNDVDSINAADSDLVAIDCLTEGIHSQSFFKQYRTDKKYIIFSNGHWEQSYYQLPIDYVLVHHLFFLLDMADTYNSPNRFYYFADKSYDFDTPKSYDFVTTIGNVRKQRTQLVDRLLLLKNKRKCIIRYSGQDFAEVSDDLDIIKFAPGEFDPYITILPKYFYTVSQTLPMKMYNAARFNVVVETDIDFQNCFFLTEKTIKVLLSGMPFVSVSHPNFLSKIRKLGFITYNSLWDESYDQETDFDKRIDMVVQLCDTLCDFDWDSHRQELELIKLKNQSNFLNLNRVCDQEFLQFEQTIKDII